MKADDIHISDFDFLTVTSLEIDREIGEHATARLSGYIDDENVREYQIRVLEHRWVTVTAKDGTGGRTILMTGMIAGFSFDLEPYTTRMTLILKSGTFLMDGAEHFRSFQNTGTAYMDVFHRINQSYDPVGIIGEECIQTAPIDFLLQYKETDWRFIKRIASHFGLMITPAITRAGAFYYVGNSYYATYHLLAPTSLRINKRVDTFMKQGANAEGSPYEQDYMEYQITVREIYDLWDKLVIGNEGGHICRIHSEYRRGELLHTYFLRPAGGMKVKRVFHEEQSGCSFQATVSQVMQDMVQIILVGDEHTGQDISRWFPYSTGYSSPDGPGWYCMPEIGDQVRLQIPDSMEEHGYVISAVHRKTGNARKNPEHKSLKTRYGKELLFTPESLEMTNNHGMSIKITDGEGIQIVSNQDISIISGGTMTLSSETASLMIAGTERVEIKQGGAGLHLEEDVTFTGGKFRIQ